MSTKLIAQIVRGAKFAIMEDDGWSIEPFTWSLGDGSRRYGLAAVNEAAASLDGYIDEWGEVEWDRLHEEKGREAWNLFQPLGLDVDAVRAPDPAPAGFAECCEVLAATIGLLSITADGQQLWAITNADDDIADDETEDVGEDESDEEAYEDEDV